MCVYMFIEINSRIFELENIIMQDITYGDKLVSSEISQTIQSRKRRK